MPAAASVGSGVVLAAKQQIPFGPFMIAGAFLVILACTL
jgi:prepilin signal peptidase PulO-like enzyme (type II secretory pathway)